MAATETSTRAAAALDDLYRHHVGEVYRYTYAVLGNHADAEDVTQTTFVNALRALERGERPRKASNWLITITHNIMRQRFRQQQARPAEVELVRDVARSRRRAADRRWKSSCARSSGFPRPSARRSCCASSRAGPTTRSRRRSTSRRA